MEIRLEGAGSCEKHSNYLTFEQRVNVISTSLSLCLFLVFFVFFFGWFSCGTLVPQAGIQLEPPALGAWSLTHWITREVPVTTFYEPMLVSQFNIQRKCFCFMKWKTGTVQKMS